LNVIFEPFPVLDQQGDVVVAILSKCGIKKGLAVHFFLIVTVILYIPPIEPNITIGIRRDAGI